MKQLGKAVLAVFAAAALAILFALAGSAAPAFSVEQAYTQPGGGVFYGTPYGDELFRYVLANDGSVLTEREDGTWVYAGTDDRYLLDVPSALVSEGDWAAEQAAMHPVPDRSEFLPELGPTGEEPGAQALTGTQNLLVILTDFTDVQIQHEASWPGLIFGAANSVKHFYGEATGGGINITPARETYGTVNDGVVRVSLTRVHPDDGGNSTITRDAIKAAANLLDFASYDANNDKKITPDELHILIICAGYEGAYNNQVTPNVWGYHSTNGLNSYGTLADGMSFCNFAQVGELHKSPSDSGHMATMGIICHEMGHDFGLPDLYGNGNRRGLGGFSLMSNGSWGRLPGKDAGSTPVFFDAYCLELLGLFPAQAINQGQSFEGALKSISTGQKNILRVNIPGSKEYFLLENRQPELYDQSMQYYLNSTGKGGIAVYRINTNYKNNYTDGQQVAVLLEANQSLADQKLLQNKEIYNTDPFYYISGARPVRLNRTTMPSTDLQGNGTGWFNFLCKSAPQTSMNIALGPILTVDTTDLTLDYKRGKGKIAVPLAAGKVSFTGYDKNLITVDDQGNVNVVPGGKGTTTVTVGDGTEFTAAVSVTVKYNWWQWLIVILLFGWIWY